MTLLSWVAALLSWQIHLDGKPWSSLLTPWISASSHTTTFHYWTQRACPLCAEGFGAVGLYFFCLFSPWHCSSVPKPTSSVKVPVSPGEDEDGERRGRTGGKLQRFRKPRGGRERLEKRRHSLKWIWGKKGKAWSLGGLGEFAGKKGRKSLAVHVDRNTQQQGAGIGLKCSGIGKPNGVWAKAR